VSCVPNITGISDFDTAHSSLIFQQLLDTAIMGVRRGGAKRAFPPLEIGTMNQKFLINLKSAA